MSGRFNETMMRERFKLAYAARKDQLKEFSHKLASVSVALMKASERDLVDVSSKRSAFTAFVAEVEEHLAVIEFIEGIKLQERGRHFSLVTELEKAHHAYVNKLERELGNLSGRYIKLQGLCMESLKFGKIVPLGKNARSDHSGEHARWMKDLAILAFIQSFGIVTRRSICK